MQRLTLTPVLLSVFMWADAAVPTYAQDRVVEPVAEAEKLVGQPVVKKINRVTEPVSYWVEPDQLRVRDNPYAGKVVAMLKVGQKVNARQVIDDWVLISKEGEEEKWVNRNFLSTSPVTWANYKFDSRGSRNLGRNRFGGDQFDINLKRIKVKGQKDVRVSAADIKRLSGDKKLIISRHVYRAGAYYEKHLVQCSDKKPTHIKILGEGYTVMMMEADPRQQQIGSPLEDSDKLENEAIGDAAKAIAEFTCETEKL